MNSSNVIDNHGYPVESVQDLVYPEDLLAVQMSSVRSRSVFVVVVTAVPYIRVSSV